MGSNIRLDADAVGWSRGPGLHQRRLHAKGVGGKLYLAQPQAGWQNTIAVAEFSQEMISFSM